MDERIEAFMKDVLGLKGENSNAVREGVRRYMAEYEKQVRIAETDTRKMVPTNLSLSYAASLEPLSK
jgi:hypothetical protein